MLNGKKIALGVTGGIAVYKAVDLVSRLRKQGAEVRVIMTEHAQQFVTPLTFKEISGNKVAVSMWDSNQEFNVEHIALANWADAFVVAPATANILAKMANGIADDLLSTTLQQTPQLRYLQISPLKFQYQRLYLWLLEKKKSTSRLN